MRALVACLVILAVCALVPATVGADMTQAELYDNTGQLKEISGNSFAHAATWDKFEDYEDCVTKRIGVREYGLVVHGQKLDEKHILWTLTEEDRVIWIRLATYN